MAEKPRKHPYAECERCDLYEIGRFVPSDGPERATLAVVGEAPGANEARLGKPFVGVSGKLLDKILEHYHIERSATLLTNACLCRPPDNATPSALAIHACRPRLVQELQERGVDTVVALGNSAARSIMGTKDGITRLRVGPPREVPELGLQIIPTFHPAACLRPKGDSFFPSIVNDFGKLVRSNDEWREPQFVVVDDRAMALAAIGELPGTPVTVDIESDVDKDVSFEHPSRHRLLCVGIGYAPGKVCVFGENASNDNTVLNRLGSYLRTHNRIVAQNGKFDLEGLFHRIGAVRLWFDTMLASYALDERRGIHGLKYLATELLGTPRYGDEIKRYLRPGKGYGVIPRDVLYKYNAYDCAATFALYQLFDQMMTPELRALHDFLVRASNELMYPELNGIGVDLKYNDELAQYYSSRLSVLGKDMQVTSGRLHFNPNSPLQIIDVLEKRFGITVPKKRNQKGELRPCTDKEVIASLVDRCKEPWGEYYDFLTALQEHRLDAKSFGTYVKGIRRRVYKGRVFPTFLLHGTNTGRLSSRNPNLQNITRGPRLRRQFVPVHRDNVFVNADYKQIEARVLTWLAKEDYLRDIFNNPERDLFDELTPVLYGDTSDLDKYEMYELRIRVKAYFYGLGYGREAKSIAEEYGITVSEAQRGMRAFFGVIPNIVEYREQTRKDVLAGEDLVTPFGRHRRFWLITKENKHEIMNEALAFKPQSIASDICLQAFTWVRPALKGIGYVRNIVHDNIIAECHKDDANKVADILRYYMVKSGQQVVGDYVSIDIDVKTGTDWGQLLYGSGPVR
jgi:uracil-DNA glycosylase family 4